MEHKVNCVYVSKMLGKNYSIVTKDWIERNMDRCIVFAPILQAISIVLLEHVDPPVFQ